MILMDYLFLLRTGEYMSLNKESHPLCLCKIGIGCCEVYPNILTNLTTSLQAATFHTLEFNMQKNDVHGEVVFHANINNNTL